MTQLCVIEACACAVVCMQRLLLNVLLAKIILSDRLTEVTQMLWKWLLVCLQKPKIRCCFGNVTKHLLFPAPNRSVRGLHCSDSSLYWCCATSQTSQGPLRDLGYDVWRASTGKLLRLITIQLCPKSAFQDHETAPQGLSHIIFELNILYPCVSTHCWLFDSRHSGTNFEMFVPECSISWRWPHFGRFSPACSFSERTMFPSCKVDWYWRYWASNSMFAAGDSHKILRNNFQTVPVSTCPKFRSTIVQPT